MQYKVGDTVFIRKSIKTIKRSDIWFAQGMKKYLGTKQKIQSVQSNGFIKLEGNHWTWCDEFFEPREKFYLDI